jgi:hypothetical protein
MERKWLIKWSRTHLETQANQATRWGIILKAMIQIMLDQSMKEMDPTILNREPVNFPELLSKLKTHSFLMAMWTQSILTTGLSSLEPSLLTINYQQLP